MKTCTLTTLFVIALVLAACQPATSIPPTATLTPEPPTFTPTFTPTISVTPTLTPTPTVGPGGFPHRFHVEGNAFVDQFDQKMMFRGVNQAYFGLARDSHLPELNEHYYQVMASWGANIIRVPIFPSTMHNHSWSSIFDSLDQTIAWAGENKMYVVIDFHSGGSIAENWYIDGNQKTNLQEFLDFWDEMSRRYDNNDTVAFYELFNEPATPTHPSTKVMWMTWKGIAEQAISVIRANDPDKIILVGGLDWAYNLSFVEDAPIASDNIGYTTHPYPVSNVYYGDWDTAFGKLSDKYPVFATEIGYQEGAPLMDNKMIGNIPYRQAIIDYLEEHQIGWMVWIFDVPDLLAGKNFTPSPRGEYFRSRLFELNFPGIPTPTPLPTPTGKPGNLAYGKPATASSVETISFPAKNAVDGNPDTRWSSGFSDPQWIQVDLGDSYHINRVVLNWEASYGVAYKIQISINGSDWTTVYSTTNGDGGIDDLSISGSGRYIRMYGTSRVATGGVLYGYSLYEFEVYGGP